MNIVALYKGFEGTEFLDASIESIYPHVSKIVVINSDVSWSGNTGNTVHKYVDDWKDRCDGENKIVNIMGSWTDQYQQYMHGIKYCQENLKFDYFLIIDTDEVWDDDNLERAKGVLAADNGNHSGFHVRMYTYVKSPFYRVEPVEPCTPMTFCKSDIPDFGGIRGSGVHPSLIMENVYFHHFCYVRLGDDVIRRKFTNSHIGDKADHSHCDRWMSRVWNRIPRATNFHPTSGSERCWQRTRIIGPHELPASVRCKDILNHFPR
jgi:glycosyltransferase involved in cell wall biosynthesis